MEDELNDKVELLLVMKNYINNLNKYIDDCQIALEEKIAIERKNFDISMEPFRKEIDDVKKDYNQKVLETINVKLGDLINEISRLTGVNNTNMGLKIDTNIGYWGKHNLHKVLDLMDREDQVTSCTGNYDKCNYWELTIYEDKKMNPNDLRQSFYYRIPFKLDLEKTQYDGKSLLEHCNVKVDYDNLTSNYYTSLVIDKDIDNIKCPIEIKELLKDDIKDGYGRWYPSQLLIEAIKNCSKKENDIIKLSLKK